MDSTDIIALADTIDRDLARRVTFVLEIDKLKTVIRRSLLTDGSRLENTAEHSWHLAMTALVLAPHAGPDVDLVRAVEILLVHDLVEIDAGDVYIYDDEARQHKKAMEDEAADRIFGLLDPSEGRPLRALWDEYEARETPTARFAYAIDRLQPLLLNASSDGRAWQENGIHHSQAHTVNAPIGDGSPELWALAEAILGTAADEARLVDDRPPPA